MDNAVIVTIIIAAVTMVGNILFLSIWGTWKIANVQAGIMEAIFNHKKETASSFEAHQRLVGETMSAIRQKINDVELWGRDNYVAKDDFTEALNRLNQSMVRMDDSLGARLIRMEAKIDAASPREAHTYASIRRGSQGAD